MQQRVNELKFLNPNVYYERIEDNYYENLRKKKLYENASEVGTVKAVWELQNFFKVFLAKKFDLGFNESM